MRNVAFSDAELRCWNHKIVNVLDHFPLKIQAEAKALLRVMPYANTQAECERLRDEFGSRYRKPYPKAVQTLGRDWERMVAFYDFPTAPVPTNVPKLIA